MPSLTVILCVLSCFLVTQSGGQGIGINYGLLGDNLASPDKVVDMLKTRNIQRIRIFEPNTNVLRALQGSNIEVVVGVRNEDLQQLSVDPSYAKSWVETNIVPHASSVNFRYIAAGNEIIPGQFSPYVLGAMKNLASALKDANIVIPVSLTVAMNVLASSYPPSAGAFTNEASYYLSPIVEYLAANGTPLLVSVYPYFAHAGDPNNVRQDYALFTANMPVVQDGSLVYDNLFDAMVDAVHAALDKVGGQNVGVVVSESGWPSAGDGDVATIQNAQTYNRNLISHVLSGKGTPMRPQSPIEAYIFALFNENQKPAGVEQNWGLYQPDLTEVYHVDFP